MFHQSDVRTYEYIPILTLPPSSYYLCVFLENESRAKGKDDANNKNIDGEGVPHPLASMTRFGLLPPTQK